MVCVAGVLPVDDMRMMAQTRAGQIVRVPLLTHVGFHQTELRCTERFNVVCNLGDIHCDGEVATVKQVKIFDNFIHSYRENG